MTTETKATQAQLSHAYFEGRAKGDALVELFRPEGLEHLNGLPDYMGLLADTINTQPCDATGSAAMHGFVTSFIKELINLNRTSYEQARELRELKGEVQ